MNNRTKPSNVNSFQNNARGWTCEKPIARFDDSILLRGSWLDVTHQLCHISSMPVLNARQLHQETSAILDEVSKGKSFEVERHGKVIATIRPAQGPVAVSWDDI